MWQRDNNLKDLRTVKTRIKASFSAVREEMDEHLGTINKNTEEIQSVYDYLTELDNKLEKLSERMDEIDMLMNPYEETGKVSLTRKEKEVFALLYTSHDRITTIEIARGLGLTEAMIETHLGNMVAKGLPIIKTYSGGLIHLSLNPRFKDLQAKRNILEIV